MGSTTSDQSKDPGDTADTIQRPMERMKLSAVPRLDSAEPLFSRYFLSMIEEDLSVRHHLEIMEEEPPFFGWPSIEELVESSSLSKATDSEIVRKTQSLCTAKDTRESTQLIMKPFVNWEEFLAPAPLSIAILGELVNISSESDFSINKSPPIGGLKYIKYPDSFCACLMQVCSSGSKAFDDAHKNMCQIHFSTLVVIDCMARAAKTLYTKNDAFIQVYLPDLLDTIQDMADDCVKLASAAEERFGDAIHVIQELLQASMSAEHCSEEELKKITLRLEEAKRKEQSSQELDERCRRAVKRMEEELEEAEDGYKKAMESLPSEWEIIGMDFVEGLAGTVTGLLNGMTSILTCPFQHEQMVAENLKDAYYHRKGECDLADIIDEICIYCRSGEILDSTKFIGKYIEEKTINWTKLYDDKNKKTKTDFAADQFKRIQNVLKKYPDCTPKDKALLICETGINICQQLADYAPRGKCNIEKTNQIISTWQELNTSALAFDSASKNATKSPCLTAKPPVMNYVTSVEGSGLGSAGQRASENAHFCIEQARVQLAKAREQYNTCVENMEINQKELADILFTMLKCDVNKIDFNTKVIVLIKCMDAMGKVKTQWEKMVHILKMLFNISRVSFQKNLTSFVTHSMKKLSYNDKMFSKDLLYIQISKASNIASLVHMISETYIEVSSHYLMASSLGKLMAMDKSQPQFKQKLKKLKRDCHKAQRGILVQVHKSKRDFESRADEILKRIEEKLQAILPIASAGKPKAIKEAVQAGFSRDDLHLYQRLRYSKRHTHKFTLTTVSKEINK